ncbi:MAG: hypothetical protein QW559_01885 [Candidatus Woesearchaeota archaeon]
MALFLVLLLIFLFLIPTPVSAGVWTKVYEKPSPSWQYTGYCDSTKKCFYGIVNQFGDLSESSCSDISACYCIDSNQAIKDNYCEDGNWTTRTKFVAQKLADFATGYGNFALYCDSAFAVFPAMPAYFPSSDFNNWCILRYGPNLENLAFGTSLNKQLAQDTFEPYFNLKNFDPAACVTAVGWKQCGVNSKLWFNPQLNATIWLPSGSLGTTTLNIRTLFNGIKYFFLQKLASHSQRISAFTLLNRTEAFDRIYYAKAGNKMVFAYAESKFVNETFMSSIGGEHSGLDFVCSVVSNYCLNHACDYWSCDDSSFKIYHWGLPSTDLSARWQDLTSKLRLQTT